jgi:hypothetical protein
VSTQNIMWTALPNGFTPAGDKIKLSVLVSPRLITSPGPTGTLAQFPDFLDWPKTVSGLSFKVEFQGGPMVAASPAVEPGFPALDSVAWTALFNHEKNPAPVQSYAFDDRSDLPVRSFPTKKVLSFLKNLYQQTAVQFPSVKPTISQLGFDPTGGQGLPLGQIAIYSDEERGLEKRLTAILSDSKAVPANFGTPKTDFLQVRIMHRFLSKVVLDDNGHRVKLPDQKLPDVDFHKAVAAMGQYQKLMRALGLAIDLEVPITGVPLTSQLRVHPSLAAVPPMVPWTSYRIDPAAKHFFAAPLAGSSDVSDGMLLLSGTDQYDVVEVDIDGAAEKVQDFAYNMARLAFGDANKSIDTPDNYGLPALRSAGFSAARVDRAVRLVNTFRSAKSNNTAITTNPQNSNVVLHPEDIARGYRIDVWDSMSATWHSLCLRDGTYNFLNGPLSRSFSDEGFVTVATSQSADGTSTDLRLPESLFRWAGWSLCVPRAGRTIGADSTAADPSNPATTDFKLEASFTAPKGTLPRLRFGAQYQFRARAVDLACNSLPFDAPINGIYTIPPQPIPYLRYEPVVAPAVVLRENLDPVGTPGESGNRMVIRSNFDTHIAAVSERHIAPPKTSQTMAEEHGMLDTPAGPPDKGVYAMLVNKDGSFSSNPADLEHPVAHPEAQLLLPYLPDPFASGAAFRGLPGTATDSVWKTTFSGAWPNTLPFRFVLDEGLGVPQFTETATERVLRVQLPKADVVTVALSCYLTDDPTTKPPNMLSTMKVWAWMQEVKPSDLAQLYALALDGGHWMMTPPSLLTLVHAVQKPLLEPQFQNLQANKVVGKTYATLTDKFPISGKSTIKVDIQATWQEPVDDGSDDPQPKLVDGAARAFEVPFEPKDTVAVIDDTQIATKHFSSKHEFHDTKHRKVAYTAVATTRFKEYFPDALTADPNNVTRTSQPVTISVLNSSRPAAPKPLYVVPTFKWESETAGAWSVSKRSGRGLRVYLNRPWFSSGEGELLGAVLWGCAPPPHSQFNGWSMQDSLKAYVTQWGKDPIWTTSSLPSQAMPLPEHFLSAVAVGTELSLDEVPTATFTVVGHDVAYDNDRKLWYCDIVMDSGEAYFPFVRLALVRYQPQSVADAHLSRVVLAEFAQLLPDRAASITFDPIDLTSLDLAITGLTYSGPGSVVMTVTLQTQPSGGGDQAWVPLVILTLTPTNLGGPDTLWTTQIVLPAPRGSRPFRLLIEEFEFYIKDHPENLQKRLVYADVLNL